MDIALDFDGVVARQTEGLWNRIVTEHNPDALHYSKWYTYHIEEMFPELGEWVGEQFSDPSFFIGLEPYADAAEWIHKTIKDHRIVIVTARYDKLNKTSWAWFKKHGIPISQIYHVRRKDKPELLKGLNPSFMVEDDPRNAQAIADCGFESYLVNRPYNLDFEVDKYVKRIDSMDEIDL